MDKTTKRRLEELEARMNSKSGPVAHIRVVYVDPPKWEDDDETRKQRERANASTAAGQS
jgi:hypothetical protein